MESLPEAVPINVIPIVFAIFGCGHCDEKIEDGVAERDPSCTPACKRAFLNSAGNDLR
jgi:hypothetical protein